MLEHDLRLADREAVLIHDPAAQDEGVVVEAKVGCVDKQHLANLQRLLLESLRYDPHTMGGGRSAQHIDKVEKALTRYQPVGLQQQLAAKVLKLVDRQAVGIQAGLDGGHAS